MSFERGWKHFSRAVSKPFSGANIPNLQQLEIFILAAETSGYKNVAPTIVKHGAFDFSWAQVLNADEYSRFRLEWVANLQANAGRFTASSGPVVTSHITPAIRTKLFQERGLTDMWNALQNTKDRHRTIAKKKVEGFFDKMKRKLEERHTELDNAVHRHPLLGLYLSYYDAANTSFEHGSVDGAVTEPQRNLLLAGGLYKVIKKGASAVTSTLRVVVTAGADLKAVKSLVSDGVSALNSLGGLLAGIVDLASGRDADWRTLSARFGVDQKIDKLWLRVQGRDQAAIRDQVISGPQQLERGAALTEEDLLALRKQLRHSFYWVEVFEKDIEAIEEELAVTDFQRELTHVMTRLQTSEDTGLLKPSQIAGITTVERSRKEELKKQLAEAKKKVGRFKLLMEGDLRKLDIMLSAVDTRRGIASQQRAAVDAGLQYDTQRVLATEIASFDRTRLRSARVVTAAPTVLSAIRTFDRSKLRAAELRTLHPAPPRAPKDLDLSGLLTRISTEHAEGISAAAVVRSVEEVSPRADEWETD